jgi:hypothetical protein
MEFWQVPGVRGARDSAFHGHVHYTSSGNKVECVSLWWRRSIYMPRHWRLTISAAADRKRLRCGGEGHHTAKSPTMSPSLVVLY